MKNFVLLGLAGYVAPKHLEAIKAVGGNLIAAMDLHDSVGCIDSYFPECQFFTKFEGFSQYCETTILKGIKIDYVVICSPNHLHVSHCLFALSIGANVICEKPLALTAKNIDVLGWSESQSRGVIFPILQLRLHPEVIKLKEWCMHLDKPVTGFLDYITPRGDWYKYSWKGDTKLSGGIATNIGIHLFDLLVFLFGEKWEISLNKKQSDIVSGCLTSNFAEIKFSLSIQRGKPTQRVLYFGDKKIDFTQGFTDLHTISYQKILEGKGFCLADTKAAVSLCERIRIIPDTD